jgi:hypothetical protein
MSWSERQILCEVLLGDYEFLIGQRRIELLELWVGLVVWHPSIVKLS